MNKYILDLLGVPEDQRDKIRARSDELKLVFQSEFKHKIVVKLQPPTSFTIWGYKIGAKRSVLYCAYSFTSDHEHTSVSINERGKICDVRGRNFSWSFDDDGSFYYGRRAGHLDWLTREHLVAFVRRWRRTREVAAMEL